LAGGYLFNLLVDFEIKEPKKSDIDIFFYDTKNSTFLNFVNTFVNHVTLDKKQDVCLETKFYKKSDNNLYDEFQIIEVTIKQTGEKFQFINKKEIKSPLELIKMFNIKYVQIYYDFKLKNLFCTEEALKVYEIWNCDFSQRCNLNIKALNKGMRLRKLKNNNKTHHTQVDELGNFNGMCWIGIDYINENLLNLCKTNFNKIWNYHPKDKSKIVMREQNISANRYLQSYLNTPSIETVNIKKSSYMFSIDNKDTIPEEFNDILQYVNNKFYYDYNQIVVNWYENGDDYLPFHKDWTNNRADEFNVSTVTLCEDGGERDFIFMDNDGLDDKVYKYTTTNGMILTLGGMTNTFYKHGIPKQENKKRRISITFRHFEMKEINENEKDAECCDV
jgi:hypothetical protein